MQGSPGIVIPTLNEAVTLPRLLEDLAPLRGAGAPVVVADGGSTDGTPSVVHRAGALLAVSPPGRGGQLRAGVRVLEALPGGPPEWLLLLHADSRLPPETLDVLRQTLAAPGPHGAFHFAFRLDARGAWWRILEVGQRIRQGLTGLAYGDQGLLVRRDLLAAVGGVPSLPIMEDVALLRALRRRTRVRALPAPVVTSPRRYQAEGPVRGWLRNAALMGLFGLGVPAERLARRYRPHGAEEARSDPRPATRPGSPPPLPRTLVVFVKAPVAGQVKTRLARTLGDEAAAELYEALGRTLVHRLRTGPWLTAVHHAPPEAGPHVARWLETHDDSVPPLLLRPQPEGDLGARMLHALETATTEAGRTHPVVVVGTDAPGVTSQVVEAAFQALEGPDEARDSGRDPGRDTSRDSGRDSGRHRWEARGGGPADLVLAPALDGGYALIGQRTPTPELFRDIPWSTPRVLDLTRSRAREAGLRVVELPPLLDIDDAEDLAVARAEGLLDDVSG
ncbi:MAG: DUF2064 domain-containing protein [Gemmatimonadales bacterium]|nr:MAG: DUF2064 domain-containing protein [Gemmatimonadales bacterium]